MMEMDYKIPYLLLVLLTPVWCDRHENLFSIFYLHLEVYLIVGLFVTNLYPSLAFATNLLKFIIRRVQFSVFIVVALNVKNINKYNKSKTTIKSEEFLQHASIFYYGNFH